MNFYGIDYLESQTNINDFLKYFVIFLSLIILVVAFSFYLRHRIQTKYRDLSIIMFLIVLFISGVQYSDYKVSQTKHSQSSQMVNFIEQLAKEKDMAADKVFVNSTQLTDGILVKIDDELYKLNLSPDQSSYTLERAYLTNSSVTITK